MTDPKDEIEALKRRIAELEALQAAQADPEHPTRIKTDGGAAIGGGVRVANGHFIGRDYIAHLNQIVHGGESEEDVQNSVALYLHALCAELSGLPLGEIDGQLDRNRSEALTLRDVYVPLYTKLLKRPALETLKDHRVVILLGKPGSGKSSFGAHVLLALADAWRGQPLSLEALDWSHGGLFPIRVVLRNFAYQLPPGEQPVRAGDIWDYLGRELHALGLGTTAGDHRFLQRLAQRHGALIVFDGLDECGDSSRRARVQDAVDEFIQAHGEYCRFLLTMRPYAWTGRVAQKRAVYELNDFDDGQIERFIRTWYSRLPDRGWCTAAQAVRKCDSLLAARHRRELVELTRTPLLLTLMALLHSNRGQLPQDRAELYHETVELLLRRWSLENNDERALLHGLGVTELKWASVRRVIQELAFEVHAQSAKRAGDLDIRESALLNALGPLFGGSRDKSAIMVEYIERRTGLLLGQGAAPDPLDNERRFGFPHRSFREYLAACHLVEGVDFYAECRRLAMEAPAHWELVLSLAARVAKLSHGARAADALVGSDGVEAFVTRNRRQPGPDEWRAARVAGLQLLELGTADVETRPDTQAILHRVRHWLITALQVRPVDGGLQATERAKVGDLLAELGDPRFDEERLYLPADPDLGFVRVDADPNFFMGTRRSDWRRVAAAVGTDPVENEVTIAPTPTAEFWVGRYLVTVAQFCAFVDASDNNGYLSRKRRGLHNTRPIQCVDWGDANAYAAWLQRRLQTSPVFDGHPIATMVREQGWRVTLPSEREWEKAARGGRERAVFPWGDIPDVERVNHGATGIDETCAVGTFPANDFGLYDMTGNVRVWTRTAYAPSYAAPEQDAHPGCGDVVIRGGAWNTHSFSVRCAYRDRRSSDCSSDNLGFRLVLCSAAAN